MEDRAETTTLELITLTSAHRTLPNKPAGLTQTGDILSYNCRQGVCAWGGGS
jgi:hypothetical protein